MDDKYMEFWGNFLLNAARGKKQMDGMSSWMKDGFEEMTTMFNKMNKSCHSPESGEDYTGMAENMTKEFNNSLKEYLAMMGMVPSNEHLALVKKYEKLKEKYDSQEETIRHLKMLLTAREAGQQDVVTGMQDIAKNQTEFFRKMMDDFGQFLTDGNPESADGKKKTEKSEVKPDPAEKSEPE